MNINTLSANQVEYASCKLPAILYPSKMLAAKEGKLSFHAKTNFRGSLDMTDIANDLIATGVIKDLSASQITSIWEKVNAAVIDRVLNGSIVDCGIGSFYAKIKGRFDSTLSEFKTALHSIDIGFRSSKKVKELASSITPVMAQSKEIVPVILSVYDVETKSDNTLTPDGNIVIKGKSLTVTGTNEDVGLYFVNTDNGSETVVKPDKIAKNSKSELICKIPDLKRGTYNIIIKTQKSATRPLKTTRCSSCKMQFVVN